MTQTMPTIVLLQEEPKAIKLHMSDLLSLDATGIPGAELAMRPLNEQHVQGLVASDSSTWPAIKVAATNVGFILVDGYHRQEAAIRKNQSTLDAVVKPYANVTDMIEEAFRSDFAHGLKASEERRGDYAYWLHCTFKTMTQEEIAQRAMMSQAGVSKAIAKIEAALRSAELEALGVKEQLDIERACKQFFRRAVKFVQEAETIKDEDLIHYIQASVKQEDRNKLVRIGELLVLAYGQE